MPRKKKAAMNAFAKQKNFDRPRGEGRQDGPGYNLALRHNDLLLKYYQGQGIVPDGEWDEFWSTLKKNLLMTFRITGYRSETKELMNSIKGKYFSNLLNIKVDEEVVPPPKCLTWYPGELAWQVDLTRKIVRSSEHLSRFHEFIIAATESGSISRQEAVSMIPPLVMDIKSHHKILDMCAAPGSKTAQIIEYLHSDAPADELPTGYVIANDSDNKRCYLMVHQVKRLQSPCFIITNHDATHFPKIRTNTDIENPEFQLFDRILCDVPCSGDGTMRKNFDVWTKWHPQQGPNMHGLQSKILKRGCELLEVGGRLVYSTCSLNPIEDEAVVAEMLRVSKGAMKLVDISDAIPNLKYTKGVSKWKVMTKSGEWIGKVEELPEAIKTTFKPSIFPPSEEEAAEFHLDRCMRILPHHQDTGGFFIAVLEKSCHLPGSIQAKLAARALEKAKEQENSKEEEKPEQKKEENQEGNTEKAGAKRNMETNDGPPQKKQKFFGNKEDPFIFMLPDDSRWPQIKDFFGFKEKFPSTQILYRSHVGQRTLYFVSQTIRNVAQCNENRIKFINMGVKAFSKSPSPLVPDCDFRITNECLATMVPFLSKRIVHVNKQDAITMTSEENPFNDKMSEKTQEQLKNIPPGSTVFIFRPTEEDPSPNCEILFCGWRGKTSTRCFGTRLDRAHILNLLGEDLKEINKRVEEKKKAKLEAQNQSGEAGEKTDGDTEDMSELPPDDGQDSENAIQEEN